MCAQCEKLNGIEAKEKQRAKEIALKMAPMLPRDTAAALTVLIYLQHLVEDFLAESDYQGTEQELHSLFN